MASVASNMRAMSAVLLDLLGGQREAAGLHQVNSHPPVAHRRKRVGLEEQLHDQQHFGDAAVLLHHLAEFARQHRDREPLRINPRVDGPLLELIHDVRDADLARAFHRAGVAGGAQPDGVALEDLVLEVAAGERHDLARRVIHVDAQRAYPGAGAALDAAFQLLAPRHAHDLSAKAFDPVRIVFNRALYFHHKCLRRNSLPLPASLSDSQRLSVISNDLPSNATIFRHIQRYLTPNPARKSQHALPKPLHFLCMKSWDDLAELMSLNAPFCCSRRAAEKRDQRRRRQKAEFASQVQ